MKRNHIFRIEFPNTKPLYLFTKPLYILTKSGYVGLTNIINDEHATRGGMIYPITYWQFIKEWLYGSNSKRSKNAN